jgi:hypothetical protein
MKGHSLCARASQALSGRLYASAGAWLFAAALGTCQEPAPPPVPTAEAKPQIKEVSAPPTLPSASLAATAAPHPKQQTPTTRSYMLTHYADSVRMRQAVVAGKLSDVQAAAAAVSNDAWTPKLRGDYQPYVQAVRDAARSVQSAASLTAAATALGKLGETCADCHLKFGGPGSPIAPVPLSESADSSMAAHALATDRLWAGLILPSDTSWLSGARVLVDAPALDSDVSEVAAAARHLRELARQGGTVEAAQRSKTFASVILTCAACHERLGIHVAVAAP